MNLYLHIPFCRHKCSYCHFYSEVSSRISDYCKALVADMKANLPRDSYETIYLGGGTPSLLSAEQLSSIFKTIQSKNQIQPVEITMEANPESVINLDPAALLAIGINRLSLGIQSWNDDILRHMGRQFDRQRLTDYITEAKKSGLTNINIDHIITYPGQSDDILKKDIETTIALHPTHIAVYPLEIHEGTSLGQQHLVQDEARIVHQFGLVQLLLQQYGYRHYEELNFAQPGFECRHNRDFWLGKDYLGFGPGAVGKVGTIVTQNKADVTSYIQAITAQVPVPATITYLSSSQQTQLKKDLRSRIL